MKKVFNYFLIVFFTVLVLSTVGVNKSEASINSAGMHQSYENSDFIRIVRTVENGVRYIVVYSESGLVLAKCEEL